MVYGLALADFRADGQKEMSPNTSFAPLYCAIFRTPYFRKSLKFFGTSIASLDPETVQLPACYSACQRSLALA